MSLGLYDDMLPVPSATRFPVEVEPPPGFVPSNPASWPRAEGRYEYIAGRLLYMPPCGDVQQDVCGSVATVLGVWVEPRPEFVFGANEAGMLLGEEVRAADAAVWRRADLGAHTGGYRRVPPVLAVEVAGQKEHEALLREKAVWYLDHGVAIVWLVLPQAHEVLLIERGNERRFRSGERLPPSPVLPNLDVSVDRLFAQL